jgi:hypothetical protein
MCVRVVQILHSTIADITIWERYQIKHIITITISDRNCRRVR